MRLIVNADDFGISPAVNYGIVDAFLAGIVRSTTIIPTGHAFEHAINLAKQNPFLGVGVHLTLTTGKPLAAGHKTLVGDGGEFLKRDIFAQNIKNIDLAEVEAEFLAQIERVLSLGITPTHLDSHHHIHAMDEIFPIFLSIAKRYQFPVRLIDEKSRLAAKEQGVLFPDVFVEGFHGDDVTLQRLRYILSVHSGDITLELMCHPGYIDDYILTKSRYNIARAKEHAILTSPAIQTIIDSSGTKLINFSQLR